MLTLIKILGFLDPKNPDFRYDVGDVCIVSPMLVNVCMFVMLELVDNVCNVEGGIAQLRDRFNSMDIKIPKPAPFEVKAVYDNYLTSLKRKRLYM